MAKMLHLDAAFHFSKFQEPPMTLLYTWLLQILYLRTSSFSVEMGMLFDKVQW